MDIGKTLAKQFSGKELSLFAAINQVSLCGKLISSLPYFVYGRTTGMIMLTLWKPMPNNNKLRWVGKVSLK